MAFPVADRVPHGPGEQQQQGQRAVPRDGAEAVSEQHWLALKNRTAGGSDVLRR